MWKTTLQQDFDPFDAAVQPQHRHVAVVVRPNAGVAVFVMQMNVLRAMQTAV